MRHEILQDRLRILHNIHIPPIHPIVHRPQRRIQQVVPRPRDGFPAHPLRRERMPLLHRLAERVAKVLLDDHGAAETLGVSFRLEIGEFRLQSGESVICAVADEEGKIDGIVRVGQLGE